MPTLNKELILKVADEIENNGPDMPKFDMSMWVQYPYEERYNEFSKVPICKTACCIAGHVSLLHVPIPTSLTTDEVDDLDHEERAADALGLSTDQAEDLFTPKNYENTRAFPRRRVAAVLRHLAHTDGEVEWDAKKRRAHAKAKGA